MTGSSHGFTSNRANSGKRRNFRERVTVGHHPDSVVVDCPSCRRGGAVVRPPKDECDDEAICCNCGVRITFSWRFSEP